MRTRPGPDAESVEAEEPAGGLVAGREGRGQVRPHARVRRDDRDPRPDRGLPRPIAAQPRGGRRTETSRPSTNQCRVRSRVVLQILALGDDVHHAVLQQELRGLEPLGQVAADGLLDDPRARRNRSGPRARPC